MQMQCSICLILLFVVELVVGRLDSEALLEIKKRFLEDPSGKVLVSWDSKSLASDGCPKNWYGISCSEGHVTSIVLNDVGLSGVLDFPALGSLKMLRNLSVASNRLTGEITAEVGSGFASLKQLLYLDLHSNGFSGDVTSLLAHLGGVVYVDISSNKFSGSLDLNVGVGDSGFVSTIRYLNISHNNLKGQLFPHDGMPYFDSLEVFDASDNQFVGSLPSFNFVVSLRVLRLGNNKLSGSLPQGLLQKSSMVLSELDVSLNELEGPIGNINAENIKVLNLSSNKLSGPLPTRVGRCAVIDLSNNMLSGNLSRIQGWGNSIEVISLSSNQLAGSLPNQTSQFLRLTSLKISNNLVDGVLPPILCTYPELKTIDLSTNLLTGVLLSCLFNSTRFSDVNLSSNKFTGTIPIRVLTPQNLTLVSLDLSHNALSGHMPPELNDFKNIESINISDNNFEGDIPDDLSDTLKSFDVSGNNLSGPVPKNLLRFPDSAFHPGNSLLVFPNEAVLPNGSSNMNTVRRGPRMKSAVKAALIAGLVGSATIVALLIFLVYYRTHQVENGQEKSKGISEKKGSPLSVGATCEVENQGLPVPSRQSEALSSPVSVKSSANISPSRVQDPSKSPNSLKVSSPDKMAGSLHLFDSTLRFTAEELSCAPAEVVGTSCHGTLYKAALGSGHVLAVKWLKEGILKNRKDFAREVKKLGNIRHPNLVSLLGYYWGPKEHERLIISTYVNSPCLALYLHDKNSNKLNPLSLMDRLKIAADVARCLCYLHHKSAIPHGNLKSTNILVETPNLRALLTDYSLHRIMTSAGTADQVVTAAALGYRPPEFASTSKPCPSLKSDVYAFGVVLLELLTGKSSAEIVPGNSQVLDLTEWVRLLAAKNQSFECFDPSVLGTGSMDRVYAVLDRMLQVALRCILPADERPDMRMVFEELSSVSAEYTSGN